MSNPRSDAVCVAEEAARGVRPPEPPALGDLHRAHIRVIALQRNINALALQHRDMQQELAKAEAEFVALRQKMQEESGLIYNDQTLALEPKGK